uniref:Uncharacterized protein n=1 Tax=Rhizophora mucronata TaxID=61149 RepID=A0A2P2R3R8_RHIMU
MSRIFLYSVIYFR